MGGLRETNVYGDIWMVSYHKDFSAYFAKPIENLERVPAPRVGHSCILIGNAFIVFGGDTAETNEAGDLDDNLYFFNINSLKWTIPSPKGPKPPGRYGHTISVVTFQNPANESGSDGWSSYLYVFGGQLDTQFFNDLWCFDLSNFRKPSTHWRKVDPRGMTPPPLANHCMCVYSDCLYVFGGNRGGELSNELLRFEPSSDSWSVCKLKGPFNPPPLEEHSAALVKNYLFVYGGRIDDENTSDVMFIINLDDMHCFSLQSDLYSYPGFRCGHSMTYDVSEEKLIVMGGDQRDEMTAFEKSQNTGASDFELEPTFIYEFDLDRLNEFIDEDDLRALVEEVEEEKGGKNEVEEDAAGQVAATVPDVSESSVETFAQVASSTPVKERRQFDEGTPQEPFAESTRGEEEPTMGEGESRGIYGAAQSPVSPVPRQSTASPVLRQSTPSPVLRHSTPSLIDRDSIDRDSTASPVPRQSTPTSQKGPSLGDVSPAGTPPHAAELNKLEESPTARLGRFYSNSAETLGQLPGGFPESSADLRESDAEQVPSEKRYQEELIEMSLKLNSLRQTMNEKIEIANDRIIELESKNQQQASEIARLEEPQTSNHLLQSRSLEEPGAQQVSLSNKVSHLTNEKAQLQSQIDKFKPFMNSQIIDLETLNKVIKSQESTIDQLKDSLNTQIDYQKEITRLKSENETLQAECSRSRSMPSPDLHDSISSITTQMDELVALWNQAKEPMARDDSLVEQLQGQIDNLLHINAEHETASKNLKTELETAQSSTKSLADLESRFKQSMQSLNSTHKALTLSQSELEKQKDQNKKLLEELEELRVFKLSARKAGSRNVTPLMESEDFESTEPEDDSELRAHYDMRLKDLQADLFIMTQERDQLRQDLVVVKKKLLNSEAK